MAKPKRETHFTCMDCRESIALPDYLATGGAGYAIDVATGGRVCYPCCGKNDERNMRETGKGVLYLVARDGKYVLTNWPATLTIPVDGMSTSSHNIARTRTDVWFTFDGAQWHGTQYGDMSQICRVQRNKRERYVGHLAPAKLSVTGRFPTPPEIQNLKRD